MKQQWLKLSEKIDALTLRERGMVFAAIASAILFVIYTLSLDPLLTRQKQLLDQISQQQNQIAGIDNEIVTKAQGFNPDPDAANRAQLQALRQQLSNSSAALQAMQKGLVAPEKMTPLLEHMLRSNGKLQLLSLTTLPVSGLSEAMVDTAMPPAGPVPAAPPQLNQQGVISAVVAAVVPGSAPAAPAPATAAPVRSRELLYRHGVEIVLQGNYLDMIDYMNALETLPTQLFWGKATLDASAYPKAQLTLTLYTLSLDQKWMKL